MKLKTLCAAIAVAWSTLTPAIAVEQASFVTPVVGPMNMSTFANTHLNPALRALATCSWGTTAPANGPGAAPLPLQCWWDTSATPYVLKTYDGTQWVATANLNASTHVFTIPGHIIGTNVQAYDADLLALAGLTSANNKCFYWTGTATAATFDCTSFGRSISNAADAAALRTLAGAVIGTNVQAFDADLAAIAGLTSANNKCFYFTGSGTAATFDCSTFGRSVANAADAAALRTLAGTVIGTNVEAWDADLDCLAALASNGIVARTGAGTCAVRTLTAPAAGFTITNGDGVAGAPTFVLANDLAALEGLASTGIARRTGTDAWSVGTAVGNSELAAMAAYTVKGNATGSSAAPTDISIPALTQKASPVAADKVMIADSAASNQLKYATVSSLASAGSVASIDGATGAFTLGPGLARSSADLRVSLAFLTNSLGADVNISSAGTYFTGPTVAQGTSGTWCGGGNITVTDLTNSANIDAKLWDGTTVIASAQVQVSSASMFEHNIHLSGCLAAPAGNIRISAKSNQTTSVIRFNRSGESKDSTVTVFRIAP